VRRLSARGVGLGLPDVPDVLDVLLNDGHVPVAAGRRGRGSRRAAGGGDFPGDERLDVAERVQLRQLFVGDCQGQDFFGENHNLDHRE
jgi:hypothetical protein